MAEEDPDPRIGSETMSNLIEHWAVPCVIGVCIMLYMIAVGIIIHAIWKCIKMNALDEETESFLSLRNEFLVARLDLYAHEFNLPNLDRSSSSGRIEEHVAVIMPGEEKPGFVAMPRRVSDADQEEMPQFSSTHANMRKDKLVSSKRSKVLVARQDPTGGLAGSDPLLPPNGGSARECAFAGLTCPTLLQI